MIAHIDLNSFFARVEQQAHPHLRNRPIGILGKGHKGARTCICAASPEAKRFGVTSGMSVREAQTICPQLRLVPPDYPKYLAVSRQFMTILTSFTPKIEIFSIDEAFIDLPGPSVHILETVLQIRERLHNQLGELITVNVGIAWGKVFAKLAGELHKPDGIIFLEPTTWLHRVGDLPVTELCGVGRRLGDRLSSLGIQTIQDLHVTNRNHLIATFGRGSGIHLWEIGQGIDRSSLATQQQLTPAKSIGHQITLDRDLPYRKAWEIIAKLTKKVGRRLRKAHASLGRLDLYVSLGNDRHATQFVCFRPPILYDQELMQAAKSLFAKMPLPSQATIRRAGIVASHLAPAYHQPLPLFRKPRDEWITNAFDQILNQFGEESINWGSTHRIDLGDLRDWRGPRAVLDQ